jgi:hypothetical protein
MKLRTAFLLAGLSVGTLTSALNEGCGGSKETAASATSKTPPAASGPPTTSTDKRAFAVNAISLGEADRAGNRNKDAWKSYGFDLDGRITVVTDQNSPDLKNVCKRAANARPAVHNDGDQGVDNAFGKEIIPILDTLAPSPSKTVTESIHAGTFTLILEVVGLTDDPLQTNTGLSATILLGGDFHGPPPFDLTTDWPYVNGADVPLPDSYITKGVFVSGHGGPTAATLRLNLSIRGRSLIVPVHGAIVSFKHNPAGQSLDEGTIAGIINTEEFVTAISSVAGSFDPSLCQAETLKSIQDTIRQSSDSIVDGPQDPNKTCDGISIGLGFGAKRVAPPTKVAPDAPPPPDPCTAPRDAGIGG